jgi:2-dehydro-3-deoxy-D-arabinonate dehydratase
LSDKPPPPSTEISLRIVRKSAVVFEGSTRLSKMKRKPADLVEHLFRDNSFPDGCYLLTGTGIVPESDFTLAEGDEIEITIEPMGTLRNRVRRPPGRSGLSK